MSALAHLRDIARGIRPADDGLLGNARFACGQADVVGAEAILAAFAARPFDLGGELLQVETLRSAALIGEADALVADLYDGRVGRLWRVGDGAAGAAEPRVDVAFDADLQQERGDVQFRPEDHPDLGADAAAQLLEAGRRLTERLRSEGKLRARAFFVRAFGDASASAALLAVHTLDNEDTRTAGFSYAVLGSIESGNPQVVRDQPGRRDWTPRL